MEELWKEELQELLCVKIRSENERVQTIDIKTETRSDF